MTEKSPTVHNRTIEDAMKMAEVVLGDVVVIQHAIPDIHADQYRRIYTATGAGTFHVSPSVTVREIDLTAIVDSLLNEV